MNRDAIKAALRRRATKVAPARRAMTQRTQRLERVEALVGLYDQLREHLTSLPHGTDDGELPDPKSIELVRRTALDTVASNEYLRVMTVDGDFDRSLVTVVRRLLDTGNIRRARSFAQVIRHRDGMQAIGDVCLGLVVMHEPLNEVAWELFNRVDVAVALHLAPGEYFEAGFDVDPAVALDTLARLLAGEFAAALGAPKWLDIARGAFLLGAEDLSARAARRAARALPRVKEPGRREELRRDIEGLRSWYGRREQARAAAHVPAGEIPFAVADYQHPGRRATAITEGEALNTLAVLGNLVRRRELVFTGDLALAGLAETLHARVRPERATAGPRASVHLVRADRDASSYSAVPPGTWMIVSGAVTRRELGRDLPLNPNLLPIFLGVEIAASVLHGDGVIDYLRTYAPIGCRDWRTVSMLRAAGVPAYFSGWLTTTVDTVATNPVPEMSPATTAPLARAVVAELNRVAAYRTHAPARTTDVRTYLAARAMGRKVTMRPDRPGDAALDGSVGLSDAEFDRQRAATLELTATVLDAVLDGQSADSVYALWRDLTRPAVEAAERRLRDIPSLPSPSFDVAAAVKTTLADTVVRERTEPAPDGPEINVEFSLDGNFKYPLDIVLDSIVTRASRPIRAFVLCRDHDGSDFDRMAKLFPTVSFVWLPTDHADYGTVRAMLRHITVATMDRLLLPDLLPDVDRIIHHDLDALCLADLAELFDLDLDGSPLAARDQREPFGGSGYVGLSNWAARADTIEQSFELLQHLTARHPFDFRNINAGILVLDLARMRADNFTGDFLPMVERFGLNDQGVLNMYAGSQARPLPRVWNAFPRFELVDDAKILHWLGGTKPWRSMYIEGQQLWREAEKSFARRAKAAGVEPMPRPTG